MGWNFGPYFAHNPPRYTSRPDTIRLSAEIWTDSFRLSDPVSRTARSLSYRFLPGGTWTSVTPASVGPQTYGHTLLTQQNATSIEYYFTATDHRDQTSRIPPEAPSRVFSAQLPPSSPNSDLDLRKYNRGIIPSIDGQVSEWAEVPGALG